MKKFILILFIFLSLNKNSFSDIGNYLKISQIKNDFSSKYKIQVYKDFLIIHSKEFSISIKIFDNNEAVEDLYNLSLINLIDEGFSETTFNDNFVSFIKDDKYFEIRKVKFRVYMIEASNLEALKNARNFILTFFYNNKYVYD